MKKIDITNWKEFEISNIFDIVKGTRLTKANMHKGNINFVGASAINNGITCKIGNTEHLHPAGTITVSYNGSVGEAFYQTEVFWASDDINVLYPKFPMNHYIALFILPIIKQIGKHYAFVDKWKKDDMEKDTIPLPILKDNTPNWQYMENYMRQIEQRQRANLQIINDLLPPPIANKTLKKCNIQKWNLFRIGELFDIHPTKAYKLINKDLFIENGINPVVVNSSYNNGIGGYTNLPITEKGNKITFSDTTTADSIFYQKLDFVGYPHVQGLYPKQHLNMWNQKTMLFFCTIFRRAALAQNFDYGNKFTREIAKSLLIPLPVLSDGAPDWNYMEHYITMLMDKQARNLKQLA